MKKKKCNICGKSYPDGKEYWHKSRVYKDIIYYHKKCKKCRTETQAKKNKIRYYEDLENEQKKGRKFHYIKKHGEDFVELYEELYKLNKQNRKIKEEINAK